MTSSVCLNGDKINQSGLNKRYWKYKMNIFYLDDNPKQAAQWLCDKHVVKMGLEAVQVLSTALYLNKIPHEGYRPTHVNHPCVKWATKSRYNYYWVYMHALYIFEEYTERYGRIHKANWSLEKLPITPKLPDEPFAKPPCAMPKEYVQDSVIESYKLYYIKAKRYMATWKQNKPDWFK
jgi:hypothetical protein